MSHAARPASSLLSDGHKSVAVFLTEHEARERANAEVFAEIIDGTAGKYYIMDRRGAWEVIRYEP